MILKSTPFREPPLGARFKYKQDSDEIYIVMSQCREGVVAELVKVESSRAFQGVYSAFESAQERMIREVWAVVDGNGY